MMQRLLATAVLVAAAAAAVAQDMPLSQLLIEKEDWKLDKPAVSATFAVVRAKDGKVYVAHPEQQKVVVRDAAGKETDFAKLPLRGLAGTKSGTLYCTVPNDSAVYAIGAEGPPRKIADGIAEPTGIRLSADEGTLYVADAAGKYIHTFRVEKDGALTCRENYSTLQLPPGKKASGASSMTLDAVGRLYVATTLGIQVFDTQGRLAGVIARPEKGEITALSFGGADGDLLYATCGEKLYARKLKAKGAAPDK